MGEKLRASLFFFFLIAFSPKISGNCNLKDRCECFGEPSYVYEKESISKNLYYISLSSERQGKKKCDNRKLHLIIDQKRGFISDYSRDFF